MIRTLSIFTCGVFVGICAGLALRGESAEAICRRARIQAASEHIGRTQMLIDADWFAAENTHSRKLAMVALQKALSEKCLP